MKWGRNESVIWPPHGPINTWSAIFLSFVFACSLIYLRFAFGLTPLQQFYLPYLLRSQTLGLVRNADKYQLVMVAGGEENPPRLAGNDDVAAPEKKVEHGQLALALSPAAKAHRIYWVYQQPKTSYVNKSLSTWFQAAIYGGEGLWDLFKLQLLFGLSIATTPVAVFNRRRRQTPQAIAVRPQAQRP